MERSGHGLPPESKGAVSNVDTSERRKPKNKKKSKNKKVNHDKPLVQLQFPTKPVVNEIVEATLRSGLSDANQTTQKDTTEFAVYAAKGIAKLTQINSRFPRARFKCMHCAYFIDDLAAVDRHLREERHKKCVEAANFIECLSLLVPPPENIMRIIDKGLIDAKGELNLTVSDYKSRNKYKEYLNKKIGACFPGCYLELYGSSLTRFGFKNSNINLNFNVPLRFDGPATMLRLKTWLEKDENIRNVSINVGCDVPSITFKDRKNKVLCDVALNNTEAVKLSEHLANYASVDERVIPLGITFRQWAEVCKLASDDDGGLPKHAFAVMTVFYLQHVQPPILPIVPIVGVKGMPIEAMWDNKRTTWKSENTSTVGELWLGLLKFFSVKFPVSEYVVCIDKCDIEKCGGRRKITIEDPFQPKLNIARSMISDSTTEYFLYCMRTTFKHFAIPHTADGPIYHHVIRDNADNSSIPEDAVRKEVQKEIIKNMLKEDKRFKKNTEASHLETEVAQKKAVPGNEKYSNLTVTVSQAHKLNSSLNDKYVTFNFSSFYFTGGKKLPLVCTFCMEDNHTKKACPLNRPDVLVEMSLDHIMNLERVCEYVLGKFAQTPEQVDLRKSIVIDMEDYISKLYPNVRLELFGSTCNGFGLQRSDLDICLTFRGNDTGADLNFIKIIDALVIHLKGYRGIRNLIPVTSAKVPIIKFNHSASDLDGDISIYNILAQNNTRLLKVYSDIDRRVKILGYVMKRFAKLCNICDASRGSLSSYAYILMVIYFLQQCDPPVLPVLQELPGGKKRPEKLVEGWNVYFYDDIANLRTVWPYLGKNKSSVGSLWCELLHFYAEKFDFKTHVISVRQKEPLLRFSKLWTFKCMAIEDPFDLNHNLASGLSRLMHLYIMKAFKKGQVHFREPVRVDLSIAELEMFLFKSEKLIDGEPPTNRRHGNGPAGRKNRNKKPEESRLLKNSDVPRSPVKQGSKFEQAINYGRIAIPGDHNSKDNFHGRRMHAFNPGINMGHNADLRNWRLGSGNKSENAVQSRVFENSGRNVNMNRPLSSQPQFHYQVLNRDLQQIKPAFWRDSNGETLEPRVEILGNNSPSRRIVDITSPSRR